MLARAAIKPRRRNSPRPAEKTARGFLQWLRGRSCACEGTNPDCSGKMQAAHVPHKASKGTGTKSSDAYCIPLTEGCHLYTQHRIGWASFAINYLRGRSPAELAEAYWQAWPGRAAWMRKQEQ